MYDQPLVTVNERLVVVLGSLIRQATDDPDVLLTPLFQLLVRCVVSDQRSSIF